jgi:hypothetical protein
MTCPGFAQPMISVPSVCSVCTIVRVRFACNMELITAAIILAPIYEGERRLTTVQRASLVGAQGKNDGYCGNPCLERVS